MARRRGTSMRTLFEVRGVTWAVLLVGCLLIGGLAYGIASMVTH